jgi:hypothetical protein
MYLLYMYSSFTDYCRHHALWWPWKIQLHLKLNMKTLKSSTSWQAFMKFIVLSFNDSKYSKSDSAVGIQHPMSNIGFFNVFQCSRFSHFHVVLCRSPQLDAGELEHLRELVVPRRSSRLCLLSLSVCTPGCGSNCLLSLTPFHSEQPSLWVISIFPLLHKMCDWESVTWCCI